MGIVGHEGEESDLAPPSTIYTKEHCHLIRVDRKKFHALMGLTMEKLNNEKSEFLKRRNGFLSQISTREHLLLHPRLIKQVK